MGGIFVVPDLCLFALLSTDCKPVTPLYGIYEDNCICGMGLLVHFVGQWLFLRK